MTHLIRGKQAGVQNDLSAGILPEFFAADQVMYYLFVENCNFLPFYSTNISPSLSLPLSLLYPQLPPFLAISRSYEFETLQANDGTLSIRCSLTGMASIPRSRASPMTLSSPCSPSAHGRPSSAKGRCTSLARSASASCLSSRGGSR